MFTRFPKDPGELHAVILETTLLIVLVIEAIRFIGSVLAN
jgi:hypothetical protein